MTASTPDIRPTDIGPTDISPTDIRWMGRALELAERGRGMTSPNPAVGAVVVADGRALGEGFHARAGAAPGDSRVGVGHGRDDAPHSGPQDVVDTGRRPAGVIARLERDVEIGAAGEGSRRGQG